MRNIGKIFCIAVAALCCGLLPSGCARDDVDMLSEGHDVEIELNIGKSVADATTGKPTEVESKIYSLRVYAFSGGRSVGHYYKENITFDPETNKHTFYMDLTFFTEGVQRIDFYVVANEKNLDALGTGAQAPLSETTTEAQLNNFWFSNLVRLTIEEEGLPMFDKLSRDIDFSKVQSVSPTEGEHAGHPLLDLLGNPINFELKRPVGKISLFAAKEADEDATLRITKVTVPMAGTQARGYLMPQSDDVLRSILPGGVDIDIAVVNTATGGKTGAVVEKTISADATAEYRGNPEHYTPVLAQSFYPFENPYGNGGSWDAAGTEGREHVWVIEYEFDNVINGEAITRKGTGEVHMPRLERNKYYIICCLIRNDGHLSIEYSVADWVPAQFGSDETPIELDYPSYENPIQPASGLTIGEDGKYAQPEIWYNADPNSNDGSYTFLFTVYGPHGLKWTPSLFGALGKTDNFEIEVYEIDSSGNSVYLVDTGDPNSTNHTVTFDKRSAYYEDPETKAMGRRYYIRVRARKPLDALGTGNPDVPYTVGLGIAVQRNFEVDDSNSAMLLINGLTHTLSWAGSRFGEYIEIKQVDVPTAQQN